MSALTLVCRKYESLTSNNFAVHLIDEPCYSLGVTDGMRCYSQKLCRSNECHPVSAHGICVGDMEAPLASAIILGVGGATGVHSDSMVCVNERCFIAAGDSVFALSIPTLELLWCKQVDFATCFGVYWIKEQACLISWGEIEISRLTLDGERIWSVSGSDIFTEKFEVNGDYIVLTDFNNERYKISIVAGDIHKI